MNIEYALAGLDAQRTALPGEDNYGLLDRYSAGHLAFGVIFNLARLPFWISLASALFFDVVIERAAKDAWPELFPNPTQDTLQHIVADAFLFSAGWGIASVLPTGRTPVNTTF